MKNWYSNSWNPCARWMRWLGLGQGLAWAQARLGPGPGLGPACRVGQIAAGQEYCRPPPFRGGRAASLPARICQTSSQNPDFRPALFRGGRDLASWGCLLPRSGRSEPVRNLPDRLFFAGVGILPRGGGFGGGRDLAERWWLWRGSEGLRARPRANWVSQLGVIRRHCLAGGWAVRRPAFTS